MKAPGISRSKNKLTCPFFSNHQAENRNTEWRNPKSQHRNSKAPAGHPLSNSNAQNKKLKIKTSQMAAHGSIRLSLKPTAATNWGNQSDHQRLEKLFQLWLPRKSFRDINHFMRNRFKQFLKNRSQRRSKPFRDGESLYAGLKRRGLEYLWHNVELHLCMHCQLRLRESRQREICISGSTRWTGSPPFPPFLLYCTFVVKIVKIFQTESWQKC